MSVYQSHLKRKEYIHARPNKCTSGTSKCLIANVWKQLFNVRSFYKMQLQLHFLYSHHSNSAFHYEITDNRIHNYRPQRSCGQGDIFTGVCLSTGGRVSASLHAGMPYPPPPRMEEPPPGWSTPPPGWRTPPDGEPPPREADSSIRSTSGRYASYWNAYLPDVIFSFQIVDHAQIRNYFSQCVLETMVS